MHWSRRHGPCRPAARTALRRGRLCNQGFDIDPAKGETLSRGDSYIVVIVTDHSKFDYARFVEQAQLFVDMRNATKEIVSAILVRC
jgi:hypothetical protein